MIFIIIKNKLLSYKYDNKINNIFQIKSAENDDNLYMYKFFTCTHYVSSDLILVKESIYEFSLLNLNLLKKKLLLLNSLDLHIFISFYLCQFSVYNLKY